MIHTRGTAALRALEQQFAAGRLDRRTFIRRAVVLGCSATAIAGALAACGAGGAAPAGTVASVATTVAPTVAAAATAVAPTVAAAATNPAGAATAVASAAAGAAGAGPTKRGGGGTLKLLQWQAPTTFNPHLSSGTKDDLIGTIVYEPLIRADNDGNFVPFLSAGLPTKENGQLAADLKSATWKLKPNLTWSDGQPVTAADVVFTWQYIVDPKTASVNVSLFENVDKVEQVDDLTIRYTFSDVKPDWYRPAMLQVLPKHVFENDKGEPARNSPNNLKPVGTGPYRATEFRPGDAVTYVINERYREQDKPFFDRIELKGGGDSTSAARAVLQSGDYDYAWNLQVADAVIKQLESGGGKGLAEFQPGGGIERLFINFTDPNTEIDGERSSLKTHHPFFTDPQVRRAFALGCDRDAIIAGIYGRGGVAGVNILEDPAPYRSASPQNRIGFDLTKAGALLDAAGWTKNGQYREKGGVPLAVVFSTTVNDVRQKTQQIVKDGWEKLGIKTELKGVDAGVFFSSDAGNPDTSGHMYVDVQMYTTSAAIDPQAHMKRWTTAAAQLSQKAGKWSGGNDGRYVNPEYDRLWGAARTETDTAKRAQLFIQMNDILIQDIAMIPLVNRKSVFARAKNLQHVNYSQWATDYWNIANWTRQG